MTTQTVYGTWCNRVDSTTSSPDDAVDTFLTDWPETYDRVAIKAAYRQAIQDALPADVSLVGNEFVGPVALEEGEFDGYPVDEHGGLDLEAIVEDIDLAEIAERHELIDISEVAERLGYKGDSAAASARKRLSSWGVKRAQVREHPTSGRLQSLFLSGEVDAAIASRPGRGARTDRQGV